MRGVNSEGKLEEQKGDAQVRPSASAESQDANFGSASFLKYLK